MLGKVIRNETYITNSKDERIQRHEYNLLNADEIRTLPDNQAFFFTGNKKPVLLDVEAYFQNRKFKNKVNFSEAYIKPHNFKNF
jgi:type IV secretory pathway TraG/TraD family ATPase VirD4